MYKNKRHRLSILETQLELDRSSFISHYKDIADYLLPYRFRIDPADSMRGERVNKNILDSTASRAIRTLGAGMMSGITSPARPWFRLTTPDPDLAEFGPVKEWLHYVTNRMSTSFLRSNLYQTLPTIYMDNGTFGVAPMMIEEDFRNVMHTRSFPVGSYMVAQDSFGRVNTFFMKFRMTVRQIVETFGKFVNGKPTWENFSQYVKDQWDQGNYQTWVEVCHMICPNEDYKPGSIKGKEKKFASYHYERGSNNGRDDEKFLKVTGYDIFPVPTARWETVGENSYGTNCPGMLCLGDVMMLQKMESRSLQAIEKMVSPPMVGPTSMKNSAATTLPGGITFADVRDGLSGFRPAHEVRASVQEIEMKMQQVRDRIEKAYFVDLFLMLANSDRRQITAREVDERHEEKLLALGPVLEQTNQDVLDPLIDIAFNIHVKQGLIPPPPEELQGVNLKVEYVSIMAQAQKIVGLAGLDRFSGFVGQLMQLAPEIKDKLNLDQFVDTYSDITGVPPTLVRTDEEAEGIREQRQLEVQVQQQLAAAQQGAMVAKDLAGSKMDGTDILSRVMGVPAA